MLLLTVLVGYTKKSYISGLYCVVSWSPPPPSGLGQPRVLRVLLVHLLVGDRLVMEQVGLHAGLLLLGPGDLAGVLDQRNS